MVGAVQDAINGFPVTAAWSFRVWHGGAWWLAATAVSAISFQRPDLGIEQLRFETRRPRWWRRSSSWVANCDLCDYLAGQSW